MWDQERFFTSKTIAESNRNKIISNNRICGGAWDTAEVILNDSIAEAVRVSFMEK